MITVDWGTKVINVPRTYMTLIQSSPFEVRELDLNTFRLDLKALEYSIEGMPHERTHIHNTTVTVGGVTLARVVEIINSYTITFEDGQYAVSLEGANSNISDVVNLNQVSIRSSNSAGLIEVDTGGGSGGLTPADIQAIASAVWDKQVSDHLISGSTGEALNNGGNSSDCGLTSEQEVILLQIQSLTDELHAKNGLDINRPVTITDKVIKFGDIKVCITKNENGTVNLIRKE